MKLKDLIIENTNIQHPGFLTDKQDITNWLEKYNIKNYTINDDGSVDVNGGVDLSNTSIEFISVKFNKVTGYFACGGCTDLRSLQGAPQSVGGNFTCYGCKKLESLQGAPQSVGGFFICGGCTELRSLQGAPQSVGGDFSCGGCTELRSLQGAPQSVGGFFSCGGCTKLESLQGAPQSVGGDFSCKKCTDIESYHNVHKIIKQIKGICYIDKKPNMLGFQLIKGVIGFDITKEPELTKIFNDNLGDMWETCDVLNNSGYIEEAKL